MALVAVCLVGSVSGMSTCKTLDLELVKKKRIEAIRGQILSKLRMAKEPEPEQAGEEEDIPSELVSLYNSTEEMLKEQQAQPEPISTQQEEEEYFAKELHKFDMKKSEYQMTQDCNMSLISSVRLSAQGHAWSRMEAVADGLTTALGM